MMFLFWLESLILLARTVGFAAIGALCTANAAAVIEL
jgi:hypothetical protein